MVLIFPYLVKTRKMRFLDSRRTVFRSYRMKSLYRFKEKGSIYGLCYRCLSSTATANSLKTPEAPVERHPFSRTVLQSIHHILQSCARHGQAMEGKACHAQVIHFGFNIETLTSNILINMYSKCHLHYDARKVFDQMPQRSLVSWNTMISSHAQNGEQQEALLLFVEMQREGRSPFSEFTLSSVVCACAAKCALLECRQLHAVAIKAVMDDNEFVGTALLDLYAKCGLIKDASSVFEFLQNKSAVTWSSMVAGYVRNELYDEALVLFHRAQVTGLEHNKFTVSSAISACAGMAALIEGNQVHSIMWKTGFGSNDFVASSLVDMYARCGCIKEAYLVYTDTEDKNIVLFNSMISGFAKHARSVEAMILFEKMQQISVYPNDLTYVSILSACSHAGLVEKGRKYFDLMTEEHKVQPNVVHYSCMVDILSRAGLLNDAYALIGQMPFDATASMWGSLLGSCRIHRNLDLAEIAANKLFEIEPNNAGNHVLLSNLYAADKRWDEVAKARKILKESEVKKEKGRSWIEIKDKVHYFMVGERNHPRIVDIYLKLDSLMEDMHKLGYRADTAHDLHDVEEMKKQELLRHHSEKLAFAYGLMCLPSSVAIRIMKNLRICVDCHSFMKYASYCTKREIIVRDTNRFHQFADGRCSCGDFW